MKNPEDWSRFSSPQGFIRLILLVDWDPVGVLGYAEAMDEYDRYAPAIYDLLRNGATVAELTAHLKKIESERIGIRANPRMPTIAVASKLRTVFGMMQQYQALTAPKLNP
jgi:hypothetical protein